MGKGPNEIGARFPGAYEPNKADDHLHGRNSNDICAEALLFKGESPGRDKAGNNEMSMVKEFGGHHGESVQLEKVSQCEFVLHPGGYERTSFQWNGTCTPDVKNGPEIVSRSLDDCDGNGERATSMAGYIPLDDAFMLFLNDPREDSDPFGVVGQDSSGRYG